MSGSAPTSQVVEVLSSRWLGSLDSLFLRRRASIFMLHRFSSDRCETAGHTVSFIQSTIAALRKAGRSIVSVREIVESWHRGIPVRPGSVAFTIDDGFWDQAELGAEAFLAEDCPVTIFVSTGFVDGELWPWFTRLSWLLTKASPCHEGLVVGEEPFNLDLTTGDRRSVTGRQLTEKLKTLSGAEIEKVLADLAAQLNLRIPDSPPPADRPMTWEQIQSLTRRGIEFGPHTRSHYIVSRLDDREAERELRGGWQRLAEKIDEPVPVYAWPNGRERDFSPRDIAIVREMGLLGALATCDDYSVLGSAPESLYQLRRFSMPEDRTNVLQYATWIERCKQVLRGSG